MHEVWGRKGGEETGKKKGVLRDLISDISIIYGRRENIASQVPLGARPRVEALPPSGTYRLAKA